MIGQTTTHASLLARLSDGGDALAWKDFADRYEELLRAFCRRQGVVGSDADDVLQDVLLALTKAMPGFAYDPARGKFRSYLKTTTLHAIFRRTRQNRGTIGLGEVSTAAHAPSTEDATEQAWESEWRQYHLRLAMRSIRAEFNSTDVAVFEAYVGAARDAEEVATDLRISVDRVYQAKSRILKRLGELIAMQVEEEG